MVSGRNTLVRVFLGIRDKVARSVAGIVPQKDLEDVVQETFLRIHDLKDSQRIRNPEAFILQTARNLALDQLKRADTRLVEGHDNVESIAEARTEEGEDPVLREVSATRSFGDFCNAVYQLPEQCRRVFVLRKIYGFSQREIAGLLGISESSVEKHVARGLKLTYLYLKSREKQAEVAPKVADIAQQRIRRKKP